MAGILRARKREREETREKGKELQWTYAILCVDKCKKAKGKQRTEEGGRW